MDFSSIFATFGSSFLPGLIDVRVICNNLKSCLLIPVFLWTDVIDVLSERLIASRASVSLWRHFSTYESETQQYSYLFSSVLTFKKSVDSVEISELQRYK